MKTTTKTRTKTYLLGMLLLSLLSLTGCTKYDRIPDESEVLKKVQDCVEHENYTYVKKEEMDGYPRKCVYYFKAEDRDMEFTATSTLTHSYFTGNPTPFYKGMVDVKYVDAVKEFYRESMLTELKKSALYDEKNDCINIYKEKDKEEAARVIHSLNAIYSGEDAYHTEEWIEDNPARSVKINFEIDGFLYIGDTISIKGNSDDFNVEEDIDKAQKYALERKLPFGNDPVTKAYTNLMSQDTIVWQGLNNELEVKTADCEYEEIDIDNDGYTELLIKCNNIDETEGVYQLYDYDNGEASFVINGGNDFVLYQDAHIYGIQMTVGDNCFQEYYKYDVVANRLLVGRSYTPNSEDNTMRYYCGRNKNKIKEENYEAIYRREIKGLAPTELKLVN